ncbi:hypothetical protein JTE90_002432 [Oedothorax gibbosus]|uniref:Uncharacterized protein n=1 Tax=Oedothorax gibbosus TaxID=931172 RepID=A0AAV6UVT1_9ARAC|nr:hypothetical protein JTE90_002432 [Oedothorax gibbosus]
MTKDPSSSPSSSPLNLGHGYRDPTLSLKFPFLISVFLNRKYLKTSTTTSQVTAVVSAAGFTRKETSSVGFLAISQQVGDGPRGSSGIANQSTRWDAEVK